MIELEKLALTALNGCSMRLASSGKRFRRDIAWRLEQDPQYKLTERQALYLWNLVYTYRRQILDARLIELGTQRKMLDMLPESIYLEGDLREPAPKRIAKPQPIPPTAQQDNQPSLF